MVYVSSCQSTWRSASSQGSNEGNHAIDIHGNDRWYWWQSYPSGWKNWAGVCIPCSPPLPTCKAMFARQGKGGSWCSYNDNHNRLVGTCSMPDCRRINSDGVDGSKHLLPISITGSGNGETSPWGWSPRTVEISFEQPHIPFWEVGHQRCNNLPFPGKGWIHSDWPLALCATAQTLIFF